MAGSISDDPFTTFPFTCFRLTAGRTITVWSSKQILHSYRQTNVSAIHRPLHRRPEPSKHFVPENASDRKEKQTGLLLNFFKQLHHRTIPQVQGHPLVCATDTADTLTHPKIINKTINFIILPICLNFPDLGKSYNFFFHKFVNWLILLFAMIV